MSTRSISLSAIGLSGPLSSCAIGLPLPKVARGGKVVPVEWAGKTMLQVSTEIVNLLREGAAPQDPFTGKPIRIYRNAINQGQLNALIRAAQDQAVKRRPAVHVRKAGSGRLDGAFAKLAHWGLIAAFGPEQIDALSDDVKAKFSAEEQLLLARGRGWWTVTERGFAFLRGTVKVPRQMAVLLGKTIGPVKAKDLVGPADILPGFDKEAFLLGQAGVPAAPQAKPKTGRIVR